MEKKLESVLHDFEYQAREIGERGAGPRRAQKLSKDAERRIAKLRREFREQFDSTVVAHTTGADARRSPRPASRGANMFPMGDTVKLQVRWAAPPRCCAISTTTPSKSQSAP